MSINALSVSVDNEECVDLLLVFARGSGQNRLDSTPPNVFTDAFKDAQPESYSFFKNHKEHLDVEYPHITYKAVSIHDFPGKYDPVGYKAAGVGLFADIDNLANSEVSLIPGDYRESVEHGVAETVGYLRDQINTCKDQSIIVGGYSQGAQVMGDALAQLSSLERERILGVSFVGDPKFIAAKGGNMANPFDKPVSYPWRRGDVTNRDQGMLEPRIPYVPQDIEQRTVSYCFRMDIICSGWSGIRKNFREAHASYAAEPMRLSVNELMQIAAPTLALAERNRGGLTTYEVGQPLPPGYVDTKQHDVMFLLNDHGMPNSLRTIRYETDPVISGVNSTYPNVNYAAKGFGEDDNGSIFIPRFDHVHSFAPYTGYDVNNPVFTSSNLLKSYAKRYPFAREAMGGGDWADPHGLAVEKAAFSSGWRPESQKHIVLITERPPKDTYSFNICNATVRSWLHVPNTDGLSACFTNAGATDIWPKQQHSEFCQTIYLAITSDTCKNAIAKPGYSHTVSRNIQDAITAAQSQHIVVDVVIPNKIVNQYHPQLVTKMVADLQYLAKATGGTFLYYDQRDKFDKAAYSDAMHQILGYKAKDLSIIHKPAFDSNSGFSAGSVLAAKTNQPVVLDVSQSNNRYSSYNWDFNNDGIWDETTPGPVTEHTFETPQSSILRVAGIDLNQIVQAASSIAITITQGDPEIIPDPILVPEVSAKAQNDGSVIVSWESNQEGELLLIDPVTQLPLASEVLNVGQITLPVYSGDSIKVRVTNSQSISDVQVVSIEPAAPILVVSDEPGPPDQSQSELPPVQGSEGEAETELDPTLCYKLQQCQDESNPEAEVALLQKTPNGAIQAEQPATARFNQAQQPITQTPQVAGARTERTTPAQVVIPTLQKHEPIISESSSNNWLFVILVCILASAALIYRKRRVISS